MIGRRIVALVAASVLTVLTGGCGVYEKTQRISRELEEPGWEPLTDAQRIELIDGMRAKGSYEAARQRLTDTARVIAERISAAVPGQTWKFDDDPHGVEIARSGALCEKLSADIARRPVIDGVDFGSTFSAEGFTTAVGIVRQEAAKFGATVESSLFNEPTKRDYEVQGNGYEFRIGQIKFATLDIRGDCFLVQEVLDLPPGQLPGDSSVAPATS